MEAGPEEEGDEVFHIPIANTSANPRTVMVMDLYADTALTAVEGAGWAQVLACVAVTHLIMAFSWLYESVFEHVTATSTISIFVCWKVFELVKIIVFVHRIV